VSHHAPTLDTLLEAVLEHPDDNAPRLAYADALGDDPRAEYIRIMITAVSVERGARLPELVKAHAQEWRAPITPFVEVAGFQRGFVEYIRTDAARFLAHADTLFRRAPIRDVDLTAVKPRAVEVFASPWLARLRSLDLSGNDLEDAEVEVLARSPHLAGLRWLDLSRNRIGMAGLEALAASANLTSLGWLGFARNTAPDPAPEAYTDHGVVCHVHVPDLNKQLIARYGEKLWLSRWNQPQRSER